MSALSENAWRRTCNECGSGMNLHLQVSNPSCRCQQDSLIVAMDCDASPATGALPSRRTPVRPRSSHSLVMPPKHSPRGLSPRQSPSCAGHVYPAGPAVGLPIQGVVSPPLTVCEKMLLRYTEGGIRAPPYSGASPAPNNPLPKLRRYMVGGRKKNVRDLPPRLSLSLSLSAGAATGGGAGQRNSRSVFWDTAQAHTPLSIVPRGPSR